MRQKLQHHVQDRLVTDRLESPANWSFRLLAEIALTLNYLRDGQSRTVGNLCA